MKAEDSITRFRVSVWWQNYLLTSYPTTQIRQVRLMADSDTTQSKRRKRAKAVGAKTKANGAQSNGHQRSNAKKNVKTAWDREEVIRDYTIARQSREVSLLGRKEVLTGKAKFGIFGDGKEVAQLAMARAFKPGDTRSGYYRDQTFMFATGMLSVREFFAQLYADTDVKVEPASAGRQMNAHFGVRQLNDDGSWRSQTDVPNTSADVSPTASQMPRLVGLAYASRLYRELGRAEGVGRNPRSSPIMGTK